jgi:hypothetical protein
MNRIFIATVIALALMMPGAAFAQKKIGEGYATPTFGEIVQTMVMMKGFDINDRAVADEYGRLVYCSLYKKNFGNDVAWNKIRSEYVNRVLEKKEYFRVLYEMTATFSLDRYDFSTQSFPISDRTSMRNVGSIDLFAFEDPRPDCGISKPLTVFPPNITLQLNQPLTVDRVYIPVDKVEKILARIEEREHKQRYVYGRIRFRVTDAPGLVKNNNVVIRADVRGDIVAVDFFLDRELMKPIGGVRLAK